MTLPFALLLIVGCLKHQSPDLVYQLDREVIALKQQIAILEGQSNNCGDSTPSPIYAELVQIIPESQATLRRDGSAAEIVILVETLFSSGSMRLRTESDMVLDLLATALNLHPDHKIQVIGYTDDSPVSSSTKRYYPSNWELSAMRAGAVARELISKYNVDPNRITISGRGATHPVADNDTPEGRATNRRIIIRVEPG